VQPPVEIARNNDNESKPEILSRNNDRIEKPIEKAARTERMEVQNIARSEKIRVERQPARSEMKTQVISYQVKRGDTLASLAQKHGISVQEMARLNKLSTRGELLKGQTIKIPENLKNSPGAKNKGFESRYTSRNTNKTSARIELTGRNQKGKKSLNRDAKSGKEKSSKKDLQAKSAKRRR
jgi:LysM repeat protein